ncbi:MAG TPA: L-threonylcarbamoyladenylate synthase [Opitutaceae bacterium]|nr:L-threonylcarbamoyladenylate synthase [Opitutaceae bacterium]
MAATIYRGTPANLRRLARVLRRGGLVAVPTETVYGLAACALRADACRRIFRAKGRPAHDPLIVHVADLPMLERVARSNPAVARLARAFWPGPLTLVLARRPAVPALVTAGLPSVAVRMPAHPLLRRLLRLCDEPLAAPSANPFGYLSPTTAAHVRESLGTRIRHILDGGPCRHGLESTIVDVRNPRRPVLLRPGVITASQLARVLGVPVRRAHPRRDPAAPMLAPGQLPRHYSPRRPLRLHRRLTPALVDRGARHEAWICFRRPAWAAGRKNVFWLSAAGDPAAAGRKLFALLRRLDRGSWRRLHASLAPDGGPGAAINDRLRRAAARPA